MFVEMIVLLVISLFINFILAVIVDSHAKKRGHTGYFWLVLLFGIIGVLLYVADSASSAPSEDQSKEENKQPETLEEKGAEHARVAVFERLRQVGEAPSEYFKETIFPIYPAGFSSEDEWWDSCISPKLRTHPKVGSPTDDTGVWVYEPQTNVEQNSKNEEYDNSNEWITAPGRKFMHRELGNRGRGLLVEVTDESKTGNFFVKNNRITPESYMVGGRNGEEWVNQVERYLAKQYLRT